MSAFIDYLDSNCSITYVSGGSQMLLKDDCPFCGGSGRTYISVKRELGICHKCGKGFGAVSFVAAFENVTRAQAIKIIGGSEDRYVHLEEEIEEKESELWFPKCEKLNATGIEYMAFRGFDASFCEHLGLMQCNTNVKTKDGKIHYTAGRIIIPIKDRLGNIVSWQGRDMTGKSYIKYQIQPGFRAAESLYNIDQIVIGQPIILVEGAIDAWGWIRAGFTNVVATWGKKISKEQLLMLCALKPGRIYMAWDGDAILKRKEFAENYGHLFEIKMVQMRENDADELSSETLVELLANASDYNWGDEMLNIIQNL